MNRVTLAWALLMGREPLPVPPCLGCEKRDEVYRLIIADKERQVKASEEDRSDLLKKLIEMADPGVNRRLAPPVAPQPRVLLPKPEPMMPEF